MAERVDSEDTVHLLPPKDSQSPETVRELETRLRSHSRSCKIEIQNYSEVELKQPVYYTHRGCMYNAPCTIPPNHKNFCGFHNHHMRMMGTIGVLSYKYDEKDGESKRFVIMWKVRYRRFLRTYPTTIAVAFKSFKTQDEEEEEGGRRKEEDMKRLYGDMKLRSDVEHENLKLCLSRVGRRGAPIQITSNDGAKLSATASNNSHCHLIIEFCYQPNQMPAAITTEQAEDDYGKG